MYFCASLHRTIQRRLVFRNTHMRAVLPRTIIRYGHMGPSTWILGQASGITYYAMALKLNNRSVKIFVY